MTSLLSGVSPRDRVGQPLGWRRLQTGGGVQVTVEGKETKAVEGVVLYGPVAGSTAYCQGAITNILGSPASTVADSVPRTGVVSTKSIRNSWEDDVDLQAEGTVLIDS